MGEKSDERIRRIFDAARSCDPSQRGAFVSKECNGDISLRNEVESLLAALDQAACFLEKPALIQTPCKTAKKRTGPDLPFDRLGEFRLIRRLGEGGMGIVYLAIQQSLDRRVALKIIRPERMGSLEAKTRFRREADAVARLRHPGIMTVLGSGEEKGICYFAMELVPGRGLDRIVRETSSRSETIPLRKALQWIAQIARALDCAHRAGVIHRDVKPSNITITPEGRAMLMDFGVARLSSRATVTQTGEFRGTPHYASPEQVMARRGEIDTRTDVYSLGVTLFQAVTGCVPFEGETTAQLFRKILEEEPPSPRRLNPLISRDLDTIILTAVEKDPDHRYRTMTDFAGDIDRLLRGETILARPAGLVTRAIKRIQRNPVVGAAIGVALLAVVALLLLTPWYLVQATRKNAELERQYKAAMEAKAETERETENKEKILQYFREMLASPDPAKKGRDLKVAEMLDMMAEKIPESFAGQPEIEASLHFTLGRTYMGLGTLEAAEKQLATALEIRARLLGEEHPLTLTVKNNLATVLGDLERWSEAEKLLSFVADAYRRVRGEDHPDRLRVLNNLAIVLRESQRFPEAEVIHREVLAIQRRVLGDRHKSTLKSMNNLAVLLRNQGKLTEAEPLFREALAGKRKLLGEEHPSTLMSMNSLALLLKEKNRLAEAEDLFRKVMDIQKRVLGENHAHTLGTMCNLATVLARDGRLAEAETIHRRILAIRQAAHGKDHPYTLTSMYGLASVLRSRGSLSEALSMHRTVLESRCRILGEKHVQTLMSMNGLALVLIDLGRLPEAELLLKDALGISRGALGEAHSTSITVSRNLAALLEDRGKISESAVLYGRIVETCARHLGEEDPKTTSARQRLAETLAKLSALRNPADFRIPKSE